MKRMLTWMTAAVMVLSLAACGGSSEDAEEDVKTETVSEVSESESEEPAEEEEEAPMYQEGAWAMLEWANSSLQSRCDFMAFDEYYIYFQHNSDSYRCHYDGSGVEKLEKPFCTIFTTDGTLWGYSGESTSDIPGEEGVYSMDPETGEMTMITELPGSSYCPHVLVSGKWLCYVDNRNNVILHDLATGEEKNIIEPHTAEGELSNVSLCLYGNTIYTLFGTMPEKGSYRHEFMLASYELDSGAEKMTEMLTDLYPGGFKTSFWLEDGMVFLDTSEGAQYYHARFSDIDEDGHWNYKTEENKVGTNLAAEDALSYVEDDVPYRPNNRYILGDDLLFVSREKIEYFEDFDFTKSQILYEGDLGDGSAEDTSIGIYKGSVYIFLDDDNFGEYNIMKVSEGGVTEYIPVDLPE